MTKYDWDRLRFETKWMTKHFTYQSKKNLRYVVIHHAIVLQGSNSLERIWQVWQTRRASAHYGVDRKRVMQYVRDKDYAWSTGNRDGNRYGISIEMVNTTLAPNYEISDQTLDTVARLVAQLHRNYGLGRPSASTVKKHRDFKATACPGPYMEKVWKDFLAECGRWYDGAGSSTPSKSEPKPPSKPKPQPKPSKKIGDKMNTVDLRSTQKGSDVSRVQGLLLAAGYGPGGLVARNGRPDGIGGPVTARSVAAFQKKKGLTVDKIVGPITWNALMGV